MWLFTKYGFYSIVKKQFGDQVKPYQIRAREEKDLQNLISKVGLDESVISTLHADYHYRIIVDDDELSKILKFLQDNIDYDNFKSEVARNSDQRGKLNAYHKVWGVMYDIQK